MSSGAIESGVSNGAPLRGRWSRYALLAAFWLFLGLVNTTQGFLHRMSAGREDPPWTAAVVSGMADWCVWGALCPLILAGARRFPLDHRHWRTSVPVHLLGSLVTGLVVAGCLSFLLCTFAPECYGDYTPGSMFRALVFGVYYLFYLWIYWAVVGVHQAWVYQRRIRERELQAAELNARLVQAHLRVLQMQLHPHFLFNTLHTISALMHKDVEEADEMIAQLADLLRVTLDRVESQEVPLREETAFLEGYLRIEQARLGNRLRTALQVAPDVVDALVPTFLLQPLVENAIRHAIAPRVEGGRVTVRARRCHGRLELEVEDDGPGLPAGAAHGRSAGVGLATTRARLSGLYGDEHGFEVCCRAGTRVRITFPFREAGGDPEARRQLEKSPSNGLLA